MITITISSLFGQPYAQSTFSIFEGLHGQLGRDRAHFLSYEEISALGARCTRLYMTRRFPAPSSGMPAVPWPLF